MAGVTDVSEAAICTVSRVGVTFVSGTTVDVVSEASVAISEAELDACEGAGVTDVTDVSEAAGDIIS